MNGDYVQDMFPAMLDIFKEYLAQTDTYIDGDVLVVKYASLIVRLDKLNEKGVELSDFGREFNLKFITNGKLAIFYEKRIFPVCLKMIEDTCLTPLGLEVNTDYTYLLDTNIKWEKVMLQDATLELFKRKELDWLGASNGGKEIKIWLK